MKFHKLYLARSFFEFIASCLAVYAIANMPLPSFTAVAFITPLLISVFAVIIFREKSTWHIWAALLGGFAGMLIITKPGTNLFYYGSFFVLGAAFCWTICGLIIKRLTSHAIPEAISFYMLLLSASFSLPLAVATWTWPNLVQFTWFFFMGLTGYLTQFSLAHAFSKGKITNIMPFRFTTLVFTAIIAYLAFGEVITIGTIIGSMIIFSSAMYALRFSEKSQYKKNE